jgi:hypothetical protein
MENFQVEKKLHSTIAHPSIMREEIRSLLRIVPKAVIEFGRRGIFPLKNAMSVKYRLSGNVS